jgi:hypothetical protein
MLRIPDWLRAFTADHDKKIAKWLPLASIILLASWIGIYRVFHPGHAPVGAYIGILAFIAGVVTIWPPDGPWAKFAWFVVFGGLLVFEMNTLYQQKHDDDIQRNHDRKDEDDRFDKLRREEDDRFAGLLKAQDDSFSKVLKQNQDEFRDTIKRLGNLAGVSGRIESTAQESLNKFGDVFRKEQELFDHEEELAEALRGKLTPGNDPTPANYCDPPQVGDVVVMFGNEEQHNTALVSRFPHIVLESRAHGPVVTLDRDGALVAVVLDMKSADGKIIARLNSNGWVVNRNNVLSANKDAHGLEILDEFGADVLSVRYLNPQAISVKGLGIGLPAGFSYVCTAGAGRADYLIPYFRFLIVPRRSIRDRKFPLPSLASRATCHATGRSCNKRSEARWR